MTQKDIDIYVELIPESAAFTDNYMTGTITDKPLAIETFKKHGVDRRRYLFLTHKVFYAMLSSSGISFKIPDSFPKSMRVTEEDVELVSLNKDRILHANGKYYDNKHM
jgi:hypothetical protein